MIRADLSTDASMPDDRSPGIQVSRVRTHFDVFGFARFGRVQPEIRGRRDIDEVPPRNIRVCLLQPQAFVSRGRCSEDLRKGGREFPRRVDSPKEDIGYTVAYAVTPVRRLTEEGSQVRIGC